jgi:heptosyltransferase-3
MRILLIKPKQIGDSLILTPTISAIHAAYPEAEIWVMVRQGCDGILAGCNGITRILTLAGVEKRDRRAGDLFRQIKVVLGLWSIRFDYVFELGDGHRARLFAILARTRRRYSVKPSSPLKWWERLFFTGISSFDWETCHRVEKDFYSVSEFLPLRQSIPPLQFAREKAQAWEPGVALTDFCVVQIGSRQGHNRWGREGWREVGRGLLERVPNIVISCGPVAHEREDGNGWPALSREALRGPEHGGDASRRGLQLSRRCAVWAVGGGPLASVAGDLPDRHAPAPSIEGEYGRTLRAHTRTHDGRN